jgi:hypothetical protein
MLSALVAGRADQPQADAPPELLTRPPGGRNEPDGRRAPGSGSRSGGLWHKTASGLRRAWANGLRRGWANICMNAIVALVLFLAWWLAWPSLQVRPQAGVLSLEVFAVWSRDRIHPANPIHARDAITLRQAVTD